MIYRERIEWLDTWIEDATLDPAADSTAKPKVLLIGDSIVRGYYQRVHDLIGDRYSVARLSTSRCICDPSYERELALMLADYTYAVIHVNNGLHGWDYSEAEYAEALPRTLDAIAAMAPRSRVVWCQTTPVRVANELATLSPRQTPRILERNRLAGSLARTRGLELNDLYAVAVDHPEYVAADGVHYNPVGNTVLGDAVAQAITRASGISFVAG